MAKAEAPRYIRRSTRYHTAVSRDIRGNSKLDDAIRLYGRAGYSSRHGTVAHAWPRSVRLCRCVLRPVRGRQFLSADPFSRLVDRSARRFVLLGLAARVDRTPAARRSAAPVRRQYLLSG